MECFAIYLNGELIAHGDGRKIINGIEYFTSDGDVIDDNGQPLPASICTVKPC